MITVADVAERLHVSTKTVRSMILSGKIPAYKVGRAYRIDEDDLAKVINQSRVVVRG